MVQKIIIEGNIGVVKEDLVDKNQGINQVHFVQIGVRMEKIYVIIDVQIYGKVYLDVVLYLVVFLDEIIIIDLWIDYVEESI